MTTMEAPSPEDHQVKENDDNFLFITSIILIIGGIIIWISYPFSNFGILLALFGIIIFFIEVNRGEQKEKDEINEFKKQAEASRDILQEVWSACDFRVCSKCKDNFISPMKCNSLGTSMEFACESCGKKTWYSMIPKDPDYTGEEILDAWENIVSWNANFHNNEENFDEEIPVSFKFKKVDGDEEEDDNKEKRSRSISQEVKDKVWNRDGGKCVQCDSNEDLEYDHIIPHSKGGANTYRNIQLLCESCNRSKRAKIG